MGGVMVLYYLLQLLQLLILVRVVMSWVVSPASRNPFVEFVRTVTDPILRPIQALLPAGPLDLSPMIALLIIWLLQSLITRSMGY